MDNMYNIALRTVWASVVVGLLLCKYSGDAQAQQDCDPDSVDLPPINDLSTGSWHGLQGGLYPGGANTRPAGHNQDGLDFSEGVVPLDVDGDSDYVSGKIVFLSIGLSNTRQEFDTLVPMVDDLEIRNPYLELVNGAQGGQYIDKIIADTSEYWENVMSILDQGGLSASQVQAVWFKEADFHPMDTTFPEFDIWDFSLPLLVSVITFGSLLSQIENEALTLDNTIISFSSWFFLADYLEKTIVSACKGYWDLDGLLCRGHGVDPNSSC